MAGTYGDGLVPYGSSGGTYGNLAPSYPPDTGATYEAPNDDNAELETFYEALGGTYDDLEGRVPVYSALTEELYLRLPQYIRDADTTWGLDIRQGYPLKRYLASILDAGGAVADILDRIDYTAVADGGVVGDTSELVDAQSADVTWLPWLAQLLGVDLANTALSTAAKREAIAGASAGWRGGTREAMATAARSVLTGGRYVLVASHYNGDPWRVEVRTRSNETPGGTPDPVVTAIINARAKPAGVELVHTFYAASWDTLAAEAPTWDDWEAPGSWTGLEEIGAP